MKYILNVNKILKSKNQNKIYIYNLKRKCSFVNFCNFIHLLLYILGHFDNVWCFINFSLDQLWINSEFVSWCSSLYLQPYATSKLNKWLLLHHIVHTIKKEILRVKLKTDKGNVLTFCHSYFIFLVNF